jgi:hypothetical protein
MPQRRSRKAASSPNAAKTGGAPPVRGLPAAVRPVEVDAIGQEQNCRRALPNWLKPFRFAASVSETNSVSVLGETSNPARDHLAVVRRV